MRAMRVHDGDFDGGLSAPRNPESKNSEIVVSPFPSFFPTHRERSCELTRSFRRIVAGWEKKEKKKTEPREPGPVAAFAVLNSRALNSNIGSNPDAISYPDDRNTGAPTPRDS